jgi:hypothetical protein
MTTDGRRRGALAEVASGVGPAALAVTQADGGDEVEAAVGVAIAAGVEPVPWSCLIGAERHHVGWCVIRRGGAVRMGPLR